MNWCRLRRHTLCSAFMNCFGMGRIVTSFNKIQNPPSGTRRYLDRVAFSLLSDLRTIVFTTLSANSGYSVE